MPGPKRRRPAVSHPAPCPAQRQSTDATDGACRLALARGDLITADELLGLMRGSRKRVRFRTPGDRRRSDPLLERAQRELEARTARASSALLSGTCVLWV